MLDVEAALARACARNGLIGADDADAIAAACVADRYDVQEIGAAAGRAGNPVIPLVERLRATVGEPAAGSVHLGATSQDVIDTAAMVIARRAVRAILDDAEGAADAAAALAATHRDTAMIGRTLLQQALPTTFGLKAAGWMSGLDAARRGLAEVAERSLAVQLGGAAGTLDRYQGRGSEVVAALAAELSLTAPTLPWHGDRVRPAALASVLGVLAGACAKPAYDVTLLAQDEVAEVQEASAEGVGGSSAMAHKRNPVAAVSARACAARVPGLVATMQAAMPGEHERAAGAWHAEWETFDDVLRLVGAAARWTRTMLEGLGVDAERMAANLTAAADRIDAARRPDIGEAASLVDRALAEHRRQPT